MHLFRVAVPTAVFRQPLRRAIRSASAMGAAGVQFDLRQEVKPSEFGDTARQQLRHYLSESQLSLGACTLTTHGSLCEPERLDARIAAIRQAMEFARQLGSSVLTVRLGTIPDDEESKESQRLRDVLADLARHGNHVGATLAVSTLGNAAETLQTLLQGLDAGPLGLDFDPAGFVFARSNPSAALRTLHASILHVQARDGQRTNEGAGVETAIGDGDVAWDEFLATLAEADYRHWITVRRTGGDDPVRDVGRGVKYLQQVMQG